MNKKFVGRKQKKIEYETNGYETWGVLS